MGNRGTSGEPVRDRLQREPGGASSILRGPAQGRRVQLGRSAVSSPLSLQRVVQPIASV